MKWMQIGYLKMRSRIDYDCGDALLEQYGAAAEEFVLTYIARTYENLIDIYSEIPARLYECVQLLVDCMYENRSMVSMTNRSIVPYSFDAMISDFVRHTEETPIQCEKETLLEKMRWLFYDYTFATRDAEITPEMQAIDDYFKLTGNLYKDIEPTPKICAELRKSLAQLTELCDPYINPQPQP